MVGGDGERLLQIELVDDFVLVAVIEGMLLLIPELEEEIVSVAVADGADG